MSREEYNEKVVNGEITETGLSLMIKRVQLSLTELSFLI